MAQLYRKSALEKISSPEQLDKALTVTSSMSWLALIAVTLIIVVTVIWSIVGKIPVTVTCKGILCQPNGTNTVFMPEAGTITAVKVQKGEVVEIGEPIAEYSVDKKDPQPIYSDHNGTVAEVLVQKGQAYLSANEVIRVSPFTYRDDVLVVVCYVKADEVNSVKLGQEVSIALEARDSKTYGHMQGWVIEIDSAPATDSGMAYIMGSGNNLKEEFRSTGTLVAVTCALYPDDSTVSHYLWSNDKGAKLEVHSGDKVSAKIVVAEDRPITKLFIKLKELWGE